MPSPTTIASGVARPKAQGHATTRTDINVLILVFRDFVISSVPIKEMTAIIMMLGTK